MAPFRSITAMLVVLAVSAACGDAPPAGPPPAATHVGSATCAACHQAQHGDWQVSHHGLAMQTATPASVLGDLDAVLEHQGLRTEFERDGEACRVRTDGPDGRTAVFPIGRTFGVYPLQQYLVPFADGRWQALGVAWDSRPPGQGGQRWFHLHPGERVDHRDVLHWTRSSQNWNHMCAECHATDVRKGHDPVRDVFATTFAEGTVGCEACHGPGSRHVEWARGGGGGGTAGERGLVVDLAADAAAWKFGADGIARRERPRTDHRQLETCARCHSRRGVIREGAVPGESLLQTHRPALLTEGLYFADGQIQDEVFEYGSFLQSRMHHAGVTCSDCHQPHRSGRQVTGDGLCAKCHDPARFAQQSHHLHPPDSPGASCIACHMPARTYMVVDDRRDHSFRVPRPDLTVALGTPNACNGCHQDRDAAWAAEVLARHRGPDRRPPPHFGEVLDAGRRRSADAPDRLLALAADPAAPAIVRATALELLGDQLRLAQAAAVARLLTDGEPLVRVAAIAALRELPPARRAPLLAPLLADPIRLVRIDAARAMVGGAELPAAHAAALQEWIALQLVDGDRPEAHCNLAQLHLARGDLAAARASCELALRREPDFVAASLLLAEVLREQGDDAAGEAALRAALQRQPDVAALRHGLGLVLVRRGDRAAALVELARAARDPAVPRHAFVYGVALADADRVSEARAVLQQALLRHPNDRDLRHALATICHDAGDRAEALRHAEALRALLPDDPAAALLLRELRGR